MKNTSSYFFLLAILCITNQACLSPDKIIQYYGNLPEPVSNNAVCEGFVNDTAYVYSFAGIDFSKKYSGIHLRAFRFNTITGKSERIADLPDTLGKVAAAASRIGNIIYITGGYHVYADGSEKSSSKMHRYDTQNNKFLNDATDIPIATDDHVQDVWRDSLIYLITGWCDTENIPNVQIYDPIYDSWQQGTPTPDLPEYKSFGASGLIVQDTIYYFGGATSEKGFAIQNHLRKGVIDPDDPTQITWSISIPDEKYNNYRAVAVNFDESILWIGGSNNTFNYNGIAYDGSGGVPTSNLFINYEDQKLSGIRIGDIPMDLRGLAKTDDYTIFLAGGMLGDQKVSSKIFRIEW